MNIQFSGNREIYKALGTAAGGAMHLDKNGGMNMLTGIELAVYDDEFEKFMEKDFEKFTLKSHDDRYSGGKSLNNIVKDFDDQSSEAFWKAFKKEIKKRKPQCIQYLEDFIKTFSMTLE